MIALRTRLAALAFGTADKLLEFAVQLFDLPAPSVLFLNLGSGERTLGIIIVRLI